MRLIVTCTAIAGLVASVAIGDGGDEANYALPDRADEPGP